MIVFFGQEPPQLLAQTPAVKSNGAKVPFPSIRVETRITDFVKMVQRQLSSALRALPVESAFFKGVLNKGIDLIPELLTPLQRRKVVGLLPG